MDRPPRGDPCPVGLVGGEGCRLDGGIGARRGSSSRSSKGERSPPSAGEERGGGRKAAENRRGGWAATSRAMAPPQREERRAWNRRTHTPRSASKRWRAPAAGRMIGSAASHGSGRDGSRIHTIKTTVSAPGAREPNRLVPALLARKPRRSGVFLKTASWTVQPARTSLVLQHRRDGRHPARLGRGTVRALPLRARAAVLRSPRTRGSPEGPDDRRQSGAATAGSRGASSIAGRTPGSGGSTPRRRCSPGRRPRRD